MYCAEANRENRSCQNTHCSSRQVHYSPSVGVRDNWWFLERYHIPFCSQLFDYDWYCVESDRTNGLTLCYSLVGSHPSGSQSTKFYVPYMALPSIEPDFHNAFWQLVRICANASTNQPKPKKKQSKKQSPAAHPKWNANPYNIRFGNQKASSNKPNAQPVVLHPFFAPSRFPTTTAMPVSISSAWEVFGVVEKRSTHEEIKRRRKILLIAYHPDKHPRNRALAELHFKRVNEAYRILKHFQRWL